MAFGVFFAAWCNALHATSSHSVLPHPRTGFYGTTAVATSLPLLVHSSS
jgi:hypothetical protein